jgi:type I restriction enzyme S subunit
MSGRKKLPKGWRWAKFSEVVDIDNQGIRPIAGTTYRYIGLENIESGLGDFAEIPEVDGQTIGSGKYRFSQGHVLYGKLRPYLNKVALPEFEGICSTDILPLLPKANASKEFLAFWLRSPGFVDFATRNATGTKMPRLGPDKLLLSEIPLPHTSEEQERIVEVLQQADAIRRKRAEARRLADQILPALFLDMFGDPATNPKGWPVEPIGTLLAPEIERVNPAKAFPDEEFTYIEIAHIDNVQFRITMPKRVLGRDAPSRARQVVRAGDVLYSMTRPNLRNIAVVSEEYDGAIATTGFAILRPKRTTDAAFVFEIVKSPSFTNAMARFAEEKSLYPAVDEAEIRRFQIMTPPSGFREQFAANYEFLSDLDSNTRQAGVESDMLFSNILSRAFTGELTASIT